MPPKHDPSPRTDAAGERPLLEVQIHSSDIRKKVRYVFLGKKQLLRWGLGLAAWLGLVVWGLVAAPLAIGNALETREHHRLREQRARLGERLQSQVATLGQLEERAETLRVEMAKIHLAYGFPSRDGRGKGGYPIEEEASPVPASIYSKDVSRGYGLRGRVREEIGVLTSFYDEVREFEQAHRDQVSLTPSRIPLRGSDFVLTSPFGNRRSPFTKELDFHAGIDLAAPVGAAIHAPADGVVLFSGRYPLKKSVGWWRYGNLVVLEHGERFITIYGHCDEVRVQPGDDVAQGEVVATVGNSGWSTSPHLHYEVRRYDAESDDYTPVDPRIYILDHEWRDEERLLIQARSAPSADRYEPLPRIIGGR